MTQEVLRNYLEINSIQDLNEVIEPNGDYSLNLLEPINFQLNKFFYKNIGKKHKWIDRLVWTEAQWIDYVSNKNIETYVFFSTRHWYFNGFEEIKLQDLVNNALNKLIFVGIDFCSIFGHFDI